MKGRRGGKRGGWASGGGEAFADGVLGEFGDAVDMELKHQVAAMGFDGFDADVEVAGDFLGGFAIGNELEMLAFARREQVERGRGLARGGLEAFGIEAGDDGGIAIDAIGESGADGADQFFIGGIFSDEAQGACAEHFHGHVAVGVGGKADDFDRGVHGEGLSCGVDAIEIGHADIHDDDIGEQPADEFDGVLAGGGFADDGEAGLGGEQGAQSGSHDGVVVDQKDARFLSHGRGLRTQAASGGETRSSF